MSSVNVKMDLIRLDMVVKDIHHLWGEVPSAYLYPKKVLAQSRSLLRSDVKRSLSLAEKARRLFQTESALATRYNQIRGSLEASGEVSGLRNTQYLQFLAEGRYDEAEKVLDQLVKGSSSVADSVPALKVGLLSAGGEGCMLLFENPGESPVLVSSMCVSKDASKVTTEPRNTFTVSSRSSRQVAVSAVPPVHLSLRYRCGDRTESMEADL